MAFEILKKRWGKGKEDFRTKGTSSQIRTFKYMKKKKKETAERRAIRFKEATAKVQAGSEKGPMWKERRKGERRGGRAKTDSTGNLAALETESSSYNQTSLLHKHLPVIYLGIS